MKNRSKTTKQSSSKRGRSSHLSNDAESSSQPSQERSTVVNNPETDKGPTVTPNEKALQKRKGKQPDKKPTLRPTKEAQPKSNLEQADVTPPPPNYSRFGRPVKDANYDMHFHQGLDTSPRAVAKHQARLEENRASSATRSVKTTSRREKGNSNLASAPSERVSTPTAGSDVEVVERPVSPNQLFNWISIIMWALLGAFWRLLGLIWGVLKWLLFC